MNIVTIILLALNSVFHSKIRSWLTILGIIIGIGSFVAILSLGSGMETDIGRQTQNLQMDIINITTGVNRAAGAIRGMPSGDFQAGRNMGGNAPNTGTINSNTPITFTKKDISTLQTIQGISSISVEITGQEDIYYVGESIKRNIIGVDVINWLNITNISLSSGRMLGPSDKYNVLIGDRIAQNNFSKEILLNTLVTIDNKSFRVVGIIENSNDVIIPIDVAYSTLSDKKINEYEKIIIKVNNVDDIDMIIEEIESKLMLSRRVTERTKDFSVVAIKDSVQSINDMMGSMVTFLAIIAAISLIVGAIGIANTMFTSVLEKTKEIGIMKSIGASNFDILLLFVIISGLYGLVGGFLGVFLGSILSGHLGAMIGLSGFGGRGLQAMFSLSLAGYGLIIAIGISIISGFIPAYRASKLKPVDALRYE